MGAKANEVKETLLQTLAKITTPEQYEQAVHTIESYTDEQWDDVLKFVEEYYKDKELPTLKEFYTTEMQLMSARSMDFTDTAAADLPVEWCPKEENTYFLQKINASKPSNHICLTRQGDSFMMGLWKMERDLKTETYIPSDLFFADTIPFLDCIISVDERMEPGGILCECRVVIFDDFCKRVNESTGNSGNEYIPVGALIPLFSDIKGAKYFLPFFVIRGFDALLCGEIGYFDKEFVKFANSHDYKGLTQGVMCQLFNTFMSTWYGVQIAHLHPQVKEVFQNPARVQVEAKQAKVKQKRRKVKYIKRHVISIDALNRIATDGETTNRKCLAWYVTGHWRTYKDGKKVFVNPYWKGAVRGLKERG